MTYDRVVDLLAAVASVLTAVVAVVAYGRYLCERRHKRLRLERHLKEERDLYGDQGQRTVLHLMRHLRMTEADVLDAAFRSKLVQARTSVDEQGQAEALYFQYDDETEPPCQRGRSQF